MNTNKKGEETGRESNNSICSAGAPFKCRHKQLNKSTVCAHFGLKYDNLNGRYLDIIHYTTLGPKSTTILTYFKRIGMQYCQ